MSAPWGSRACSPRASNPIAPAKPMPTGNPHDSCLWCLGEANQPDKCKICKAFKPHARKERNTHLKQLLMESALCLQQDPAPSASVQSTPPAVPSAALPGVGGLPRAQKRSAQHRSHSPVAQKKQAKGKAPQWPDSETVASAGHAAEHGPKANRGSAGLLAMLVT